MRFLEAYDLQLYARARVVSYSLKVMASSKLFLPFRGKKLTFGPDKQSDAAHAKEVAQLREKPPTDAFDACLPQNKRPNACLLYTSPSPRDRQKSRMPSSA